MARIKLGEIFSIDTPKGKAYLHYVYKDEDGIDWLRVLPGLYLGEIDDVEQLAKQKELYLVRFMIHVAYHRKLVNLAGYSSAKSFRRPQYMREGHAVRGEFLGWHIVNVDTGYRNLVKKLTSKQADLSYWGIWNYPDLVECLAKGLNWDEWASGSPE